MQNDKKSKTFAYCAATQSHKSWGTLVNRDDYSTWQRVNV